VSILQVELQDLIPKVV